MSMNVNQDYSQFYAGTEQIKSYGSNPAAKKDTLVKYWFNTTDEHGNKVMDKMSKEDTMKAMNDISSQYGDSVIVQFSGDGLAALAEGRKFMSGRIWRLSAWRRPSIWRRIIRMNPMRQISCPQWKRLRNTA